MTAETQERLIEWTGERCVPWGDAVEGIYQHLHRYHFAARFATGKRVLDLASGEGYGAAILAARAESVVGVEIDPTAVAHSRAAYPEANLEFVAGSMLDLGSFADDAFDVVVCFEAIEHVMDQAAIVSEVRRVLSPQGMFFLSTPDRDMYNARLQEPNPFHARELDRGELLTLVAPFGHVSLWAQNSVVGSRLALIDGEPATGTLAETVVSKSDEAWTETEAPAPTFYVVVASDLPIVAPSRSMLLDFDLDPAKTEKAKLLAGELDRPRDTRGQRALEQCRRARARLAGIRRRGW